MASRINLAQAFQPADAAELETNIQQVRQNRIKLKEIQRLAAKDELVRNVTKQHTVTDPSTGNVATDHAAVVKDLYIKDPQAAESYQSHVEDMQAERVTRAATAAKAQEDRAKAARTEATDFAKMAAEELSAIDEKGDQAQAKADYEAAVDRLEAAGAPIQPQDKLYSKGRVAFFKRKLIGPEKLIEDENKDADRVSREEIARINQRGGIIKENIQQQGGITKEVIKLEGKNNGGDINLLGIDAGKITSPYGNRRDPFSGERKFHGGIDMSIALNTPIPALDSGTVVSSGKKGGYGNQVRVKYDNGREVSYSHLNDTRGLKSGDKVKKGQVVALTGSTGKSTGPHVHVEEYKDGKKVVPSNNDVTPVKVLQALDKYKGPSRMSKQGEMTLRANPEYKRLSSTNFEAQLTDIEQVVDAIQNKELQTGPGRGGRNVIDRAAVGLRNTIGVGLPGVDEDAAEGRVTAYDALQRVSTKAGIEALAGIGGNDTDRDFDRALSTTVGNLRTKTYNLATAKTTAELIKLGMEKKAFYEKWTNVAGSPQATINGQTFTDAWAAKSAVRQKEIASVANKYGLYKGGTSPIKSKLTNKIIVRNSSDYANASKGAIVVWNGKEYRKP